MFNEKKYKLIHLFNNYFNEYLLNVRQNAKWGITAVNKTDIDRILIEFTF